MKTLIVASTQLEVNKFLNKYCIRSNQKNVFINKTNPNLLILITGIGVINMASELSIFLEKNKDIDYVFNIGIGGCFDSNINFGQLYFVNQESLPEIGILNKVDEITEFQIELFDYCPLIPSDIKSLNNLNLDLFSYISKLPTCSALTVNSCTNNIERTEFFKNKFSALIESMEGYAFFEVCSKFELNYFQIRAVSNYIPQSTKNDWNMNSALMSIDKLLENYFA